jgi:hypothetical protein
MESTVGHPLEPVPTCVIFETAFSADADSAMNVALLSAGCLDALPNTAAEPSGRAPCIYALLPRLAAKSVRKAGQAQSARHGPLPYGRGSVGCSQIPNVIY